MLQDSEEEIIERCLKLARRICILKASLQVLKKYEFSREEIILIKEFVADKISIMQIPDFAWMPKKILKGIKFKEGSRGELIILISKDIRRWEMLWDMSIQNANGAKIICIQDMMRLEEKFNLRRPKRKKAKEGGAKKCFLG